MRRVLSGAALALTLMLPPSPVVADVPCLDSSTVQLNVGSQLFVIPRGYRPSITGADGEGVPLRHCASSTQPRMDQPMNAREFTITTHLTNVEQDEYTESIFGVQVTVWESSIPNPASQNALAQMVRLADQSGISIEESPVRNAFHAFSITGGEPVNFIAIQGSLITPDGHPVTVSCPSPPWTLSTGEYLGRGCYSIYAYTDSLTLRYRFRDGRYPIESWASLDAAVRAFVDHLKANGP